MNTQAPTRIRGTLKLGYPAGTPAKLFEDSAPPTSGDAARPESGTPSLAPAHEVCDQFTEEVIPDQMHVETTPERAAKRRASVDRKTLAAMQLQWPHLFDPVVPLALGVGKEMSAVLDVSRTVVSRCLIRHTGCPVYLTAVAASDSARVDLHQNTSPVEDGHREYAQRRIAELEARDSGGTHGSKGVT